MISLVFLRDDMADSAVAELDLPTTRPSGRVLAGTLTLPLQPGAEGRGRLVVVLVHGLLSHRDHSFASRLAAALAAGLCTCVYRLDLRGPAPDACEPGFRFRVAGFSDDADDVLCAARMLLEQRGLTVVGVVGHSRGATSSLFLFGDGASSGASCGRTLPPLLSSAAFCAIAPRFRICGILDKFDADSVERAETEGVAFDWALPSKAGLAVTVTPEDVAFLHSTDIVAIVRRIPSCAPLLVVHGGADQTVPVDDARLCIEARRSTPDLAAPAELCIIAQANHSFQRSAHTASLIQKICDFLSSHLTQRGL